MNTFKKGTIKLWIVSFSALFTFLFFFQSGYSQCTTSLCSRFSAQYVNTTMPADSKQKVVISFKNSGNNSWGTDEISLMYVDPKANPQNNDIWGINIIPLLSPAVAGKSVTFEFYVVAPKTPGTYLFQWQLETKGAPFGDQTPLLNITVQ